MECRKCKTENEDVRRFCRQCGDALGSICNRCGNVNEFEDKFCGICGAVLTAPLSHEHLFSTKALGDSKLPRQYAPDEIDELLSLRATVRQDQTAAEKLTQEDLDSLFK
jgi:hypothetical protein